MSIKSVLLFSGASALALPSAALACDLEGPGGRFSPFAHMMAAPDASAAQADATPAPATSASYQATTSDSSAPETSATNYNVSTSGSPASDAEPSGAAVLR